MDPLSVTASVIAILQLTTKVLSFLNDAKGASTDRERCTLELSNCYGLLISLRFRLESGDYSQPWYRSVNALNTSNGPLDQYKQALEELQDNIISKSGAAKFRQTVIWKFKKEEIASVLLRIERLKTIVQVALELDHFKLSQALKIGIDAVQHDTLILKTNLGAVQHDTQAVKQNTDALWQVKEKEQARSLTEWISTSNYPAQQSDIISTRQRGTGAWFLNSPEFQNWLSTPRQTLFCPGIPGAGKTMISAIAIDHLITSVQTNDVGVAYIYCSYKSQADQTVAGLLAAIIKQLVQSRPSSANGLKELYNRYAPTKTRPSSEEILQTLQLVLTEFTTAFIVVDALDECPTQGRSRERLVAALRDLQTKVDTSLMFTSRFIADIQSQFVGLPVLEVRATEHDVRRFVAGRIEYLAKCVQRNNNLQNEIEDKVSGAVDGMFLLARLYTDSLQGKNTPRAVRQAMEHFSTSSTDLVSIYDDAYDEALQRIDEQLSGYRELARNVLAWITYARRQLQVEELRHALAVVHGDEDLDMDNIHDIEDVVSVCAGLVTVDEESGIVRLVHYTTQEYFERARERWLPKARVDIALTCLTYLSFLSFRSGGSENDARFETRQNRYVFLDYAAQYWGTHVAEVQERIADEACEFLQSSAAVQSAVQALSIPDYRYKGYSQKYPRQTNALHLLARFGLSTIATRLYQEDSLEYIIAAVDEKGDNGRTPLTIAALHGRLEVTKWLLDKGADVNAQGGRYGNALQAASLGGHEQTVKLLLEKGADVNAQGGSYGNALQAASSKGHEQTVKLLLNKGADVNTQGVEYGNALQAASLGGHEQTVKLLLNKGADVNAQGGFYGNALQAALSEGHEQIVKLLLDKGADVNAQGGHYGNALQAALSKGHEQIVKLLLDKGADVNAQGGEYGNALFAATYAKNVTIVQLLLHNHADWTAADGHAWTIHTLLAALFYPPLDKAFAREAIKSELNVRSPHWPKRVRTAIPISGVIFSQDDCRVITDKVPAAILRKKLQIRADHPFPPDQPVSYFELHINSAVGNSEIGIGVCDRQSVIRGMPGWHRESWAYHGDDGNCYLKGRGNPYGPTYGSGDTVGCGIDSIQDKIFFTLNGKRLGDVAKAPKGQIFAVIGIGDKEIDVTVNLGTSKFVYQEVDTTSIRETLDHLVAIS